MRIAYVSASDPHDLKSWSGTIYCIGRSLEQQGIEVEYIGPLGVALSPLFRAKRRLYERWLKVNFLSDYDPSFVKEYARQISAQLEHKQVDAILSTHPQTLAGLRSDRPIVYWADSCFGGMINFYPYYTNLCRETLRNGCRMEKMALDRCRLAIYASDWAAETAIRHHGVDPHKVKVVPYGANVICHRTAEDIQRLISARPTGVCKLLFIGRIWDRKGGDLVVEVAKKLNALGVPTELTLVGSGPPDEKNLPDFIKPMGFISKTTPAGKQLLDSLLAGAHFLFVPSRAEAYGIVFCEASSFGVPSLTTNVGGIPTVVRNGVNGQTFPLTAGVDEYCQHIKGLMNNYASYRQLAVSSFDEYQNRLNWLVAAKTVMGLLAGIV